MKVHLGREMRFNLAAKYEHDTLNAGVTIGPEDLGLTEDDVRRMTASERLELGRQMIDLAQEWIRHAQHAELTELIDICEQGSIVEDLHDGRAPMIYQPERAERPARKRRS